MNRWIILLVCFMVIGVSAFYLAGRSDPGDYTKILVITLHIGKDGATPRSEEIRYGHPPEVRLATGSFQGQLLDRGGSMIRSFPVWDPRVQFGDRIVQENTNQDDLEGISVVSDDADILLILPYSGKETRFRLIETTTGIALVTIDLSAAAAAFAAIYPEDPAVLFKEKETGNIPLTVIAVGCVAAILFGALIFSMIRRQH